MNKLLGLAIGSSSMKLLELSLHNTQYRVERYAIAPTITQALTLSGTKNRTAAIAMPDAEIISKIIPIDTTLIQNDIELEAVIRAEATKYLNDPLHEVYLDFDIIDESSALLIAARNLHVDTRIALATTAGVTVSIVDVHSHALERACTLMIKNLSDVTAIVDMGKNNINVMVLREQKIIFSRAERLHDLNTILMHIERAFHFFYASTSTQHITNLLLMGGGSYIPELCTQIEKQLQIRTEIANPFLNMDIAPHINPQQLTHDARLLITACGLALRNFDL
jgi:type IV pilus assembly protein PilM